MPYIRDQGPNTTRRARLVGYDYHTPGFYFLTICQKDRRPLFGEVIRDRVVLTDSGTMVQQTTEEIRNRFLNTDLDTYVVMPNHVHLLIGLNLNPVSPEGTDSIVDVIHWWKTITTNRYISGVKAIDWPRFDRALWQTGYHDRIVRDDRELEVVRRYIIENPERWEQDTFYEDQDRSFR